MRQILNPLGMSKDPMRHIAYSLSGAWWDDREAEHMKGLDYDVITVSHDADDEQIDSLVKFRLGMK